MTTIAQRVDLTITDQPFPGESASTLRPTIDSSATYPYSLFRMTLHLIFDSNLHYGVRFTRRVLAKNHYANQRNRPDK